MFTFSLAETTHGNIVVISSNATQMAFAMMVYAMSKAAIDHMVRCLAVDLGPKNIRVNAVNPGFIPTRLTRFVTIVFFHSYEDVYYTSLNVLINHLKHCFR